jgi:hypothetical protein
LTVSQYAVPSPPDVVNAQLHKHTQEKVIQTSVQC